MNVGANRQLAAELGARYIDNTYGKIFGDFCFVTAVSASTLTVSGGNITDASSVTLAQGQTIRGRYTELTVSSGAVICYNSRGEFTSGAYTTSTFPADDTLDWGQFGTVGIEIPSGSTATSALGKTVTITTNRTPPSSLNNSTLTKQGPDWRGNIDADTFVLYTVFNEILTLSFSSNIRGIGFQIQPNRANALFAADAVMRDSSGNPINTQFGYGFSSVMKPGDALFLGFESSVSNIRSVRITQSSWRLSGGGLSIIENNRFVIGKLYIKT